MSLTRRRLLDDTYKQMATGNPIQVRSVARMRPGLTMQGWTKQASTTGAQLLQSITEETKVINGITFEPISPTEIKIYGTAEQNADITGKYQDFKAGTYTLGVSEAVIGSRLRICFTTKTGAPSFGIPNLGTSKTQELSEDISLAILIRVFAGTTINTTLKIMFNAGDAALPYEPYTGGQPSPSPDYPQEIVSAGDWDGENEKYGYEIKITGKNLFEPGNKRPGCVEGSYGEEIWHNSPTYEEFANWNCDCYLLPGKEITWTVKSSVPIRAMIVFVDKSDIILKSYYKSSSGLFAKHTTTVPDGCKKIYVSVLDNNAYNNDNIEIQIEYGTEATAYEPYKSQDVTLTSDRPLTEWDRLERRDGVWGWVHRSFEIILDGSDDEKWGVYAIYSGFSIQCLPQVMLRREGFSETIKIETAAGTPKDYAIVVGYNNIGLYVVNSPIFDFGKDDSGLDEWKAWLRNNPIRLITYLDEETFTPLQDSEQAALNALHTNYPTTILSNNQNCDMSMIYKTRKSLEVSE